MVNKTILIGNLGADPEIKQIAGGNRVGKFNVAVTEKYKDSNGQKVENTTWFSCEVWNKMADVVEKYLRKGSKVYIEGKMAVEKWKDENDQTKIKYVVKVSELKMLDVKKDET